MLFARQEIVYLTSVSVVHPIGGNQVGEPIHRSGVTKGQRVVLDNISYWLPGTDTVNKQQIDLNCDFCSLDDTDAPLSI